MLSLRDLQVRFSGAMFARADQRIEQHVVEAGLTAAARIDIYRNNVLSNYRNALRDTYPVILRLVGDEFFSACARAYARQTPSVSGDLNDFGESFGPFLAQLEQARELPYLADVARLEWNVHRVFHAADAIPNDLSRLAQLDASALASLRCPLQSSARLVESPYPIHRIWTVSQPDYDGDTAVSLDDAPERVLLVRRDYAVELHLLEAAPYEMLRRLSEGSSLGEALEAVLERAPDFDVQKFMLDHVVTSTTRLVYPKES